jgi:hypothetical protein
MRWTRPDRTQVSVTAYWRIASDLPGRLFESTVNCLMLGWQKICEPFAKLDDEGMHMRTSTEIAVVVAIGLIWSVRSCPNWSPWAARK